MHSHSSLTNQMALKLLTLFLATLVLVITKVSSTTDHEELNMIKVPTKTAVPVQIPVMKTRLPVIRSKSDCVRVCNNRCADVHNEKKMCIRACNTCCNRCKCAPPTPSSSRGVCGKCYEKMTTHGGRLKCP